MTAVMKGKVDLDRFLAELPGNIETKILRGAVRAGAEEIADGAREGCRDPEVRASIKTSTRAEPGLVTAKVQTKGPGAYKAPWLEHGTDPHFISVDAEQSGGKTVRRINRLDRNAQKEGQEGPGRSLMINGKFVRDTVYHPGARSFPFMRLAADTRAGAAIDAIGGYITTRLTKEALAASAPPSEQE